MTSIEASELFALLLVVSSMTCGHFSVQILEVDGDEVHGESPVTLQCFQSPATPGCRLCSRGLVRPECGAGGGREEGSGRLCPPWLVLAVQESCVPCFVL